MPARKRGHAELQADDHDEPHEQGLLARLRNTWQMANLMQWLYLFGKEFKIDEDFDMEELEEECLKPGPSEKLAEIGLALLKHISSHRGLTLEIFDEYTRRQYLNRRPHDNPFGGEEEPNKFAHFDVFTKLRVLHQLTVWTMSNPERFREKMPETRDSEQAQWRIEEIGWDSEERPHYVLDDNRLYRRTPRPLPPPPAPKSKAKSKSKPKPRTKGTRSSKRRKIETSEEPEEIEDENEDVINGSEEPDDGLGGDKWECLCVTLEDYQRFTDNIKRSRDPNEKILYRSLLEQIMPVIEKAEEDRAKKVAKRERELLTLEKLATAKRSSRIASRVEKEKEDQVAREADEKRRKDLAAARKDAERQKDIENARLSRMMTREQRLKDREFKRVLHEEELRQMSEEQEKIEKGEIDSKKSGRHLKAQIKRTQEALEELNEEEDNWVFDCSGCGVYGHNIDDGKHSIACERCNVWQHSACLGLSMEEAEKDDFHFICQDCKNKEEEAKQPKIHLKFKLNTSPPRPKAEPHSNVEPKGQPDVIKPDPANPSKKRKSESMTKGTALPPEKKFKSYMPNLGHASSQPGVPAAPGGVSQQNGTLSHSNDAGRPESSAHTAKSNGQPLNGSGSSAFMPPASTKSHQAGTSTASSKQNAVGLQTSAKLEPQTPGSQQRSHNPATGLNGIAATQVVSLAASADFPRMPPPQTTPTSSFLATSPNASFNGHASLPSTPAPSHPYVPQKQPSAAPSPLPAKSLQSSSPAIAPPARLDAEAKASGISPIKNSSPPQPGQQNLSFGGMIGSHAAPVLPPAESFISKPEFPFPKTEKELLEQQAVAGQRSNGDSAVPTMQTDGAAKTEGN